MQASCNCSSLVDKVSTGSCHQQNINEVWTPFAPTKHFTVTVSLLLLYIFKIILCII